ncbi:hypothetical protein AB9X29_003783 [Vibrio vulnificus]
MKRSTTLLAAIVVSMLAGCSMAPRTALVYTKDTYTPSSEAETYHIIVDGDTRLKGMMAPWSSAQTHLDTRYQLDNGDVLDANGAKYHYVGFTSTWEDQTKVDYTGVWLAGDDEVAQVVLTTEGCELFMPYVSLMLEPDIEGCGMTLKVRSQTTVDKAKALAAKN